MAKPGEPHLETEADQLGDGLGWFGRFSIFHGTSAMEMLNLPNHPPLRTRSVRKV